MECCVGAENDCWCEDEEIIYVDAEGKKFCIFHAPAEHKYIKRYAEGEAERPKLILRDDFNAKVFTRIQAVINKGEDNDQDQFELFDWNPRCNFAGTIFLEDISFEKFSNENQNSLPPINFRKAQFRKNADFDNSQFQQNACFRATQFWKRASFQNTEFLGDAEFNKVQFRGNTVFGKTNFIKNAEFCEIKFLKNAYFSEAHFRGEANFLETEFQGITNFSETNFWEDANFLETEFHGLTNFSEATFRGIADFTTAESQKKIKFKKTIFEASRFDHMNFRDSVSFVEARFKNNASFNSAIFHDYSNFENAEFHGKLNFKHTLFKEWTYFRNVLFEQNVSFSGTISKETILIEAADLSKLLLAETNIESFKFVECTWPELNGRRVIYDEIIQSKSKSNLFKLEEIYRRLKKVSKDNADEVQTSHWHYKEKEFQRKRINDAIPFSTLWISYIMIAVLVLFSFWVLTKYKLNLSNAVLIYSVMLSPFMIFCYKTFTNSGKTFSKCYLNIYYLSSGYGEKPEKALSMLILILTINAIVVSTPLLPQLYVSEQGIVPVDFISSCLWYLPLSKVEVHPTCGWNSVWRIIMNLSITLQAALFAFALRNKLRR